MPQPFKTIWTLEDDEFLRKNHSSMTNQQLADALGKKLTVTRNRCNFLGLRKIKEFSNWTAQQVSYLKRNYQKKGDVLLAEELNALYQTSKFTRKNIQKKRRLLNLHRRPHEVISIIKSNHQLTDKYVIQCCLRVEPEFRKHYEGSELVKARKESVAKMRIYKKKKGILKLV